MNNFCTVEMTDIFPTYSQ